MRIKFLISIILIFSAFQTRPQADLSLDVTVDDALVDVGQIITFTISVRNDGPETTLGAEVLAPLPAGYEFVGFEATDSGNYNPVSGIWDATGMGMGITERLRIRARVVRTTDLHFLAEVYSSENWDNDSIPNNGVDTDGDGNTANDEGDEDDGDGQIIIAAGAPSSSRSATSGLDFGECLAELDAESGFTANPVSEISSLFKFDYKIESVLKYEMSNTDGFSPEYSRGDPMELQMTYYVNSADGSILFPGGTTGFFNTNFINPSRDGEVDAAVWLSNGQMVAFVEEDGKKLAITRESAQTADGKWGSDYLNMMQFFSSSRDLEASPDPMPDYVQWTGNTVGFRGEMIESYTGMTNVIDLYLDTSPTPIRTSCILMGFMVGVLKDVAHSQCNRLLVYTKFNIGGVGSGDSMEVFLKSVKPMGITFDGSPYHPMAIGGDYGTAALANLDDFEDKMRSIEIRRQTLEREKENCLDAPICIRRKNEQLEDLRKEKSQVICEQMVHMGMEDSMAECMRNEGY